ncbi:ROK family transcriptional regulator [Microbacterium sp. CIAB417]|uniref:ROK family transcriptional regulator n=1 Tax=Microbacterium sp. CIAB417 TaxID=2860287 RepID=UPI001FADFF38|nr:ROK family transcriptional regulator [Microbacterium sp. CIAB417]
MTRPPAGPQTLLRSLNARAILEALARRGPLTRAELMGETGLSRTAVTQVLRMLETGEAVASAGVDRATHGPAATRVSLHPSLGCAAAVHIDHHAASVAIIDATGRVLAERTGPFPAMGDLSDRVDAVTALIGTALTPAGGPLRVAVVGVPGIVTRSGEIRDDQGPDGGAFRSALTTRLGCDVRMENDVNLAALAELAGTVATDLESFALLMIDDGLGAGIVIDGSLQRGSGGIAGEVMYLPHPDLPVGAPVLNEVVVADLALTNDRDPEAPLRLHLDAALEGDAAAIEMMAELARRLVLVAGGITLVVDPAAYILAGDAAHPAFVDAVRQAADDVAHLLPLAFRVSSFGREATLVGAVSEATAVLRETVFSAVLTRTDRTPR